MNLEFIRGDTQFIRFPITDKEGNPIELISGDDLYFTVKKNFNSEEILIQKRYPLDIKFSDGYFNMEITSEDTSELAYGTYVYDVEFKSGRYVKTLGIGEITLTEEVTHRRDE